MLKLVVMGLASWRLAHMLMEERGPYAILNKVRARWFGWEYMADDEVYASSPVNSMLHCIYCTSFWTSLAVVAVPSPLRVALAVNAIAIFIGKAHDISAISVESELTMSERDDG